MITRSLFLAIATAATLGLMQTGAGAQSTTTTAAPVVVHIKNFAYDAATVTIKPGDTVQFVNDDSTPHTVTATDKSFDSGNMDQNAKWSHTFKDPGTYAYICTYHTYMKGTVVVKAAQ
jgi:plastocyanin